MSEQIQEHTPNNELSSEIIDTDNLEQSNDNEPTNIDIIHSIVLEPIGRHEMFQQITTPASAVERSGNSFGERIYFDTGPRQEPNQSISERINQRPGYIRQNAMARRTNFNARSVGGPSTNQSFNEIRFRPRYQTHTYEQGVRELLDMSGIVRRRRDFEEELNNAIAGMLNFEGEFTFERTTHNVDDYLIKYDEMKTHDEDTTCSICLNDDENNEQNKCSLSCKHIFHFKCIEQWLKQKLSCPCCRKKPEKKKNSDSNFTTSQENMSENSTNSNRLIEPIYSDTDSVFYALSPPPSAFIVTREMLNGLNLTAARGRNRLQEIRNLMANNYYLNSSSYQTSRQISIIRTNENEQTQPTIANTNISSSITPIAREIIQQASNYFNQIGLISQRDLEILGLNTTSRPIDYMMQDFIVVPPVSRPRITDPFENTTMTEHYQRIINSDFEGDELDLFLQQESNVIDMEEVEEVEEVDDYSHITTFEIE